MKTHKKNLWCGVGVWDRAKLDTTEDNKKVTCKKCLRLIADEKPHKLYKVEYNYIKIAHIEAPTASKAIYKFFKQEYYFDEAGESIGEQFSNFRKDWKPKAKLEKDKSKTRTLSESEKHQLKIDETNRFMDEFNEKYPIGSKVWFQADGKDIPVLTKTRSEAQNLNDTYCVIWVEGESSSYHLDDKWILPYAESNKNIECLR